MKWKFDKDRPIYLQIMDKLKMEIISGKYQPNEKFPTVRELAVIASVNPNTMQKALQGLEQEGYLITNRTSGRVVTDDTNILDHGKKDEVEEKLRVFLEDMKKLGYEKKEIIELIKGDK